MNKLDKDYCNLLQDILENGTKKQTRNGETLSVFGRQIRHSMKDGFPLLTTKKMAWKQIVTELLWFLRGDTNIKFLIDNDCHIWDGDAYKNYKLKRNFQINQGVDILSQEEFINKIKTDDEFAKKWGSLGKIYGHGWRNWGEWSTIGEPKKIIKPGIDQITNLVNDLRTNPDSRRLMVSAWNPSDLRDQVLPPCHYGFQVYTRELSLEERIKLAKKNTEIIPGFDSHFGDDEEVHMVLDTWNAPKRAISLMFNQRSVDTFLGLPFNIASYGLLLEIIAKAVNMVPDQLIGNLGDVHLYSNHIEQAKEQVTRTPYQLPKLNINTEFWPYEGGECGEGPLDAVAVFNSFKDDSFCKCLLEEDIQLSNYQSHPTIKAPLSN